MKLYFAPMEGITTYTYRNAYREFFHQVDRYYSPFIVTKPVGVMKKKEIRDVIPERNEGVPLIPQLLSNHPQGFVNAAKQLEQMGYQEVNLNLGCPSGTVVSKGRGSGFLRYPEELEAFLDVIYRDVEVKISIKTRIGFEEPEEFYRLIKIFNQYPVEELIIHPRTRKDMYKNSPNLDIFEDAVNLSNIPLCYNGDIRTVRDYRIIVERFPSIHAIMVGRGLLANPNLFGDITGQETMDKHKLRQFHDTLYQAYQDLFDGERNVLFKMKEMWLYMASLFTEYEKYLKKIKKSQHLCEYDVIVARLFKEQDLVDIHFLE